MSTEQTYSFLEVASHLQVAPDALRQWNRRFTRLLSPQVVGDAPRYTMADVSVLLTVQKLMEEGQSDEQISLQLSPRRIQVVANDSHALTTHNGQNETALAFPPAVGDILGAIATSQQTVLSSQNTMKEMVGVLVQDNFNLKEENRKLRERMLELERDHAEYQRKEETRKERMESRMRAIEGTLSALQQQVAQLTQAQRQTVIRRRTWW